MLRFFFQKSQSYFFIAITFYWRLVALQCCISFLLYSKVNQSYIFIYPLFFRFPSIQVTTEHCATQQVLISHLFQTQECAYVSPNLPVRTHPLPLGNKFVFRICDSISAQCTCFCVAFGKRKKTISFTISSKRTKYLGIHLTEEVQDYTLKITQCC